MIRKIDYGNNFKPKPIPIFTNEVMIGISMLHNGPKKIEENTELTILHFIQEHNKNLIKSNSKK